MEANKELFKAARAGRYIGRWKAEDCLVNLAGNYDYLLQPYYVSQDFEHEGREIFPTCKEMLDAYVPPLFLEKARLAGVAVPEYYISNGYFEPPVVVDPINPFTLKGKVVRRAAMASSIAKSLTRNYTYAVCCQELPADSRIFYVRAVLGWCGTAAYRETARQVWDHFHIPIARVRVLQLTDGRRLLSDISPLPFEALHPREIHHLEEQIEWDF